MDDQLPAVAAPLDLGGPFTLDEIIELEDLAPGEILHPSGRSGRALRAIAWVTGRRVNPAYGLEDAGRLLLRIDGDA